MDEKRSRGRQRNMKIRDKSGKVHCIDTHTHKSDRIAPSTLMRPHPFSYTLVRPLAD